MLKCIICLEMFKEKTPRQLTCSEECRKKYRCFKQRKMVQKHKMNYTGTYEKEKGREAYDKYAKRSREERDQLLEDRIALEKRADEILAEIYSRQCRRIVYGKQSAKI